MARILWLAAALLFAAPFVLTAPAGASSTAHLMQREIERIRQATRFRLGPFHFTPSFGVNGGYDSNALASPEAPKDDVRTSAGSGMLLAIPFRNRGVFTVDQGLSFVYHRDLAQLRDVHSQTRFGGAIGGRRLIFRFEDEYRDEKAPPTTEFDLPVEQRSNDLAASGHLLLGWRHELTFAYQNYFLEIEEPGAELQGVPVARFLNRNEVYYRFRLSRRLTAKTSTAVEAFSSRLDFNDEEIERDSRSHGILGGFVFSPDTNVQGQILLGYKRMNPDVSRQPSFRGLIGSVDASFLLADRWRLQARYARDVSPSVIENNSFYVQNQYGGSLQVFLNETVSLGGGLSFGLNTYPRPAAVRNEAGELVETIISDRFQSYSFDVGIRVTRVLTVSPSVDYWRRSSRHHSFQKDRFEAGASLVVRF